MVTKLVCQRQHYVGHELGIFGMSAPMETLVASDANKNILGQNRYADTVLYLLCALNRDELVALNLMERLYLDLYMNMHLKPFEKGQDTHNIQTHCEYVCISLCICPLLRVFVLSFKSQKATARTKKES